MNSFAIQCITEGLQIDKASLSTKIQSQFNKTNDFYMKTGMTLASKSRKKCFSNALGYMLVVLEVL